MNINLLICWISIIALALGISNYTIVYLDSISEINNAKLVNTTVIYKFVNSTVVILHDHYLGLEMDKWVLVKSSLPKNRLVSFPVSKCLNQEYGSGGVIEFENYKMTSFTGSIDLGITLNIIFYYERVAQIYELSKMITITNTYGCEVSKGKIGQIWINDVELESFDVEIYNLIIRKRKRRKKLKLWMKLKDIKLVKSKKFMVSCITDSSLLDCNGQKVPNDFSISDL